MNDITIIPGISERCGDPSNSEAVIKAYYSTPTLISSVLNTNLSSGGNAMGAVVLLQKADSATMKVSVVAVSVDPNHDPSNEATSLHTGILTVNGGKVVCQNDLISSYTQGNFLALSYNHYLLYAIQCRFKQA